MRLSAEARAEIARRRDEHRMKADVLDQILRDDEHESGHSLNSQANGNRHQFKGKPSGLSASVRAVLDQNVPKNLDAIEAAVLAVGHKSAGKTPLRVRLTSELYRQTKRRVAKKLKDGYVLTADGASERQS